MYLSGLGRVLMSLSVISALLFSKYSTSHIELLILFCKFGHHSEESYLFNQPALDALSLGGSTTCFLVR